MNPMWRIPGIGKAPAISAPLDPSSQLRTSTGGALGFTVAGTPDPTIMSVFGLHNQPKR